MTRISWVGLFIIIVSGAAGQDQQNSFRSGGGASYSLFKVITSPYKGGYWESYSGGTKAFDLFLWVTGEVNRNTRVGTEVKYSWKAFDYSSDDPGLGGSYHTDYSCTVGYLDLTIFPSFRIVKKPGMYIDPGMCLGALLHSHGSGLNYGWTMNGGEFSEKIDGPVRDDFSQFNFRLALRYEIEIPLCDNSYLLVLNRYEYTVSHPHFFSISLGVGLGRVFRPKDQK
jgi:hypothetical protein